MVSLSKSLHTIRAVVAALTTILIFREYVWPRLYPVSARASMAGLADMALRQLPRPALMYRFVDPLPEPPMPPDVVRRLVADPVAWLHRFATPSRRTTTTQIFTAYRLRRQRSTTRRSTRPRPPRRR